jgi:hypothetical protein
MPLTVQRHRRYPRPLFAARVALLRVRDGWMPVESNLDYNLTRSDHGTTGLTLATLLERDGNFKVLSCSAGDETYGEMQLVDCEASRIGGLLTRLRTTPLPEESADRYFERGPLSTSFGSRGVRLTQPIYAFSLHRNAASLQTEATRQVRLWRVAVGEAATQKVALQLPQSVKQAALPARERAELAREALRLHEAAQRAATNDWQRAATLWRRLHDVLQRLAAEP